MFGQVDYIIIMVSDMDRSVRFYQDVLGFKLKLRSDMWTEFHTGQSTVALHGGGQGWDTSSGAEGGHRAGCCSIGFQVKDLSRTVRDLESQGVRFIMPPTERKEEGIKLAVCLDPDGLPISISETA